MGRVLPLLCCLCLASCRIPNPLYLVRIEPPVLEFDTAHARALETGAELPQGVLDREVWQKYRDSLAEPAAVVAWETDVSTTWRVLYATNRRCVPRTRDASLVKYVDHCEEQPSFGAIDVTIPTRDPGEAIALSPPRKKWSQIIPVSGRKAEEAAGETPVVALASPNLWETDAFFAELKRTLARSPQNDVLLFVHGFNVSFDEAVTRTAQVAADLPFNGAIVCYSWPSQGGVENYEADGKIVEQSVDAFSSFLTALGERLPPDVSINIVVHSMGNRLVLESLWRLPDEFMQPKRFREIVFCAPDVGVSEFRREAPRAVELAERVTLYTCMNDAALIVSQWVNKEERAGGAAAPVIIDGIETVECTVFETSLMGHSYYGNNRLILRDLFAVVKEHRPATERDWLDQRSLPFVGKYWMVARPPVVLKWTWHLDEALSAR